MAKTLTDAQAARYDAEGCVFPITVMSPEEAEGHRRRLEEAEAVHGPMHYRVKPYLFFASAAEIGRHPRLLDAIEDLLGPDILLWDSGYIIKEPHTGGHVTWHQDLTYWGLDSDALVTAWVALSPSLPENGCMRFLPGTQIGGKRAHRDSYGEDNILHRG